MLQLKTGIFLFKEFFKILQPEINQWQMEKAFHESHRVFMRVSAVTIFFVWKIFFVTRDKIKNSCEKIETQVAFGLEESLIPMFFKAFNFYMSNRGFKQ